MNFVNLRKFLLPSVIISVLFSIFWSCKGSPTEPNDPSSYIPILISPKEGAVLDNGRRDGKDYLIRDYDWTDVNRATKYNLYVKHSGSNFPGIDEEILTSFYHKKEYGSYIANHNRFGWKWKVRAYVDGMWRGWSEERSFDVEPEDTDPPVDE